MSYWEPRNLKKSNAQVGDITRRGGWGDIAGTNSAEQQRQYDSTERYQCSFNTYQNNDSTQLNRTNEKSSLVRSSSSKCVPSKLLTIHIEINFHHIISFINY